MQTTTQVNAAAGAGESRAFTWQPKRTLKQVDTIMTAPGMPFEMESRVIEGRVEKHYKNWWSTVRDFWLSTKVHDDKTYIIFDSEKLTYVQTHEKVARTATWLRDEYGCKKGDRVAIIMRNYPEYLITFWACMSMGFLPVAINAWITPEQLKFCLSDSGARVAVVDKERIAVCAPFFAELSKEELHAVVLVRGGPQGFSGAVVNSIKAGRWDDLEKKYEGAREQPHAEVFPEDDASIFYTSGTTGFPKGVLSTQRKFMVNGIHTLCAGMRAILRRGETPPAPDPNAPQPGFLITIPLFHVTGMQSMCLGSTVLGGKICLMFKFQPDQAAELIRREQLTHTGGVAFVARALLAHDLPSLQSLAYGGGPSPPELVIEAAKTRPSIGMGQAYGMTESNTIVCSHVGEDYLQRPTSTGLMCPANEILVMDENGAEVPCGTVGELWIKGPNIAKCYWRNPKATAEVFLPDGWFKTGDLGYVDAEGFVYIRDRAKDLIIRGGENLASIQIEDAVYKDERIMECAAVGVPHPTLGEEVAVVVVPKPGHFGRITEDEVKATAARTLLPMMRPVFVMFVEEIVKNPNGKISKKDMRPLVAKAWEERKRGEVKAKL